jgi:hypothetical protein
VLTVAGLDVDPERHRQADRAPVPRLHDLTDSLAGVATGERGLASTAPLTVGSLPRFDARSPFGVVSPESEGGRAWRKVSGAVSASTHGAEEDAATR